MKDDSRNNELDQDAAVMIVLMMCLYGLTELALIGSPFVWL